MGKVDTNECEWPKGEYQKAAKLFYCSPSVGCADSSPASGGAFNSLRLLVTLAATSLDREAFCVLPRSGESYRLHYLLLLYTHLC